jgi:hypothetical protein
LSAISPLTYSTPNRASELHNALTIHYTNASEEEIPLLHLLLNEATYPEKALNVTKNRATQKLIKQGQILQAASYTYQTKEK